jgi:hypothetical protein
LLRGFGANFRYREFSQCNGRCPPRRARPTGRVSQPSIAILKLRHISPTIAATHCRISADRCSPSSCMDAARNIKSTVAGRPAEPPDPARNQALRPPQTPFRHRTRRHLQCVSVAGTSMRRPARRKAVAPCPPRPRSGWPGSRARAEADQGSFRRGRRRRPCRPRPK